MPEQSVLSDEELSLVAELSNRLQSVQEANSLKAAYYDGKQRVRDLGIAIPPHLRDVLDAVVDWPGTVVDVLEERLDHNGWVIPGRNDDLGLSKIVEANQLDEEFGLGHLDALIYGIAFGVVGTGEEGEPNPLITVEPPTCMTGIWDRRRRALSSALLVETDDNGLTTGVTLYLPGEILEISGEQGSYVLEDRQTHDLDGLPVEPIVNRPRTADHNGRSEITPAIRAYTDNGIRTLASMEITREFFAAPQRWVMGADEKSFVDTDGNPLTPWESYLGKVWALSRDGETGELPTIGSFAGSSPEPFLRQLQGLAQLVASAAGMPPSYLGIIQDNPASADAIRAAEARLQKRAERRQKIFGAAQGRLMRKALWIRDGKDPGVTPMPIWRDASTPTRSAQAQEAVGLVTAGVLPPDSDVTYERIGLSAVDRQRIRADLRRARVTKTVSALAAAAEQARGNSRVTGSTGERVSEGATA